MNIETNIEVVLEALLKGLCYAQDTLADKITAACYKPGVVQKDINIILDTFKKLEQEYKLRIEK